MAKKKDFKAAAGAEAVAKNPAIQFLDTEEDVTETGTATTTTAPANKKAASRGSVKPPAGYKIDPRFIEVKSKRVQLVFRPSLYERLRAEAKRQGTSMNELLHVILDEALPGGDQ